MTKVLVTGAKGMLGQDLCPMLKEAGFEVFEADLHNMDITKLTEVKAVIDAEKPDYIVHAAAYTNVDAAETDSDTAFLINKTGSANIAKISGEKGIPVFYISTDYVFNGKNTVPYKPNDPVSPINVYGESKLAGEIAVKTHNSKHYIFRTSWLYGHKGKNFVETMIALAQKNPELRVVADQVGCPTWTVELSKAVINFIKNPVSYGTYHVCGSGSTSWHGFASKIMEFMNYNVKVIPVSTDEFPRPAKRPAYSIMDNSGICPDWQESLKKYIELRGNG
ncbi:MAG TPA: dTDP-4-dehydrorhamnose reductase [Candidatus Gastranaerophilales bacterium]|nr:dTDP-4-dehydrorhamnose reductase [Candidatus Gastranaerophilales bacterium]